MTKTANERSGMDAGWRVLFAFQSARPRATHRDCLADSPFTLLK